MYVCMYVYIHTQYILCTGLKINTAGPQITSFHSMLIHYNVDEEKLINPQPEPQCVWCLHIFPTSEWVFSGSSSFLLCPEDVRVRWTGTSTLPQSECVCV